MDKNRSNSFIYAFKFIACLFVITIHARIPGVFGDMIFSVSKFAVPFFFAVSGRFLLTKRDAPLADNTKEIREVVLKRLKKLLKITGIVYLSYTIFSLCYYLPKGWTLGEWLKDKYNAFESSRFFLFNSSRYIYDDSYVFDHMWYLFALIYVYVLIIIFAPVLRKWDKALVVLLISLLYFGQLLRIVYPIRPFDISISTWYVLRNWLLVGMPFMLMGVVFADFIEKKRSLLTHDEFNLFSEKLFFPSLVALISGIIMSYVEMLIFGGAEVYIGSTVIVVALLFMSEAHKDMGVVLPWLGKEASSMIYFYHVMIIAILDILSQNGIIPSYTMWQKPLLVIVICLLLFGGIPYLFKRGRVSEQK